jgi:3-hydroxyacyl-[acyl-carrier-protein] dehydratase
MSKTPFDTELITRILPHRAPFLLVDGIAEIGEKSIIARLYLDPQLIFFAGHFPAEPIMPGVLVVEALAQTAGLLLGLTPDAASRAQRTFFLARTEMKFMNTALPGDTLALHAELTRHFGALFRFDVAAWAGERCIAEGNLALAQRPLQEPV